MAAIIYQTDKRSGITYAYESISYWDKEKKQSRARRTLIGRVDKETGEIVPTDGRNRRAKKGAPPGKEVADATAERPLYEATCLPVATGENLGITIPSEVHRSMEIKPGDIFRLVVTGENGTLVLRYERIHAVQS